GRAGERVRNSKLYKRSDDRAPIALDTPSHSNSFRSILLFSNKDRNMYRSSVINAHVRRLDADKRSGPERVLVHEHDGGCFAEEAKLQLLAGVDAGCNLVEEVIDDLLMLNGDEALARFHRCEGI